MSKEIIFEDQGRGVLFSHMVIAEEYLKQNGKSVTDENLKKIIMKLASEKADSYTPSQELGMNPESRISAAVKKDMAPWLYGGNSIVNSLGLDKTEKRSTMIELNGAINHLVQILLKRVYGFKTTRAPNVDKADPKALTDFEYLASGAGGMSKEERDRHNTRVDVNRQIRGVVQSYITASIIPILSDSKNDMYKQMSKHYQRATSKEIRSLKNYKDLMKKFGLIFLVAFGAEVKNVRKSKLSDFFNLLDWKGFWRADLKRLGPIRITKALTEQKRSGKS